MGRRARGPVVIPYLVERRGRWFWSPRGEAKALVEARPLGADAAAAREAALALHEEVRRRKLAPGAAAGKDDPKAATAVSYPRGSIGEAWHRWTKTKEWAADSEKTRNGERWPAWTLRIGPVFGRARFGDVTYDLMSDFRATIEETAGLDTAWRTIKVWRRFWNIAAAMGYCARGADPSLAIKNTRPAPRTQRFDEGEVVRLIKASWREGLRGLACVIAICWDSQLSPGDVRKLRARHRGVAPSGRLMFDLRKEGRAKTGAPAIGTLSARAERLIKAYLDQLAVELTPEAVLFRNRSGRPYREDTLADDFAALRARVFGPAEKRQLRDLRRSAAIEAIAGGVTMKALADKMANGIDTSTTLQRTYTPAVSPEVVEMADEARRRGRALLRGGGKS
jgi:hypothetical protein